MVILAAGASQRMRIAADNTSLPLDKTFMELLGRPVISYSLDIFESCPVVDEIVLVLSQRNLEQGRKLVDSGNWSKVSGVCVGGDTRTESVLSGINSLSQCDFVMIHDGARPCVTVDVIKNGLFAAESTGAAIPVIPIRDTVKNIEQNRVRNTVPRDTLVLAQTPQIFRFEIIKKAIMLRSSSTTDDSKLVEDIGCEVVSFRGDENNIKITTPFDIDLAELIVRNRLGV